MSPKFLVFLNVNLDFCSRNYFNFNKNFNIFKKILIINYFKIKKN